MKRVIILIMFLGVFSLALWGMFVLRGESTPKVEQSVVMEKQDISDSLHTYTVADVKAGCDAEDKIFCAVELAVKCTLAPELSGCAKGEVPSFILSSPSDTERPTEISFSITKIKPIANSNVVYVYTKSQCNAVWFGLCQGVVGYVLENNGEGWKVNDVFALEE